MVATLAAARTAQAGDRPAAAGFAGWLLCLAALTSACSDGDVLQPGPVDAVGGDIDGGGNVDVRDTTSDAARLECPAGYQAWPAGALADQGRCLPDDGLQCAPCPTPAPGALACLGGPCVALPSAASATAAGPACLLPCLRLQDLGLPGSLDSCPVGSTCTPRDGGLFCVPDTLDCSCTAANRGASRPCAGAGPACQGSQICTVAGWSPCSAPAATAEVCNGADDDCDGATDEGLAAAQPCAASAIIDGTSASCAGVATCQGAAGWVCDAATPAAETCNGADDDCDGVTDEPWQIGGVYASADHCGVCGNACAGSIAHGTATCAAAALPPYCAVGACDQGYLPQGNACVPKVVGACDACSGDGDCGVAGACVATGKAGLPAKVCLLPCPASGACGKGMTCQTIAGSKRCVPAEAVCTCKAANAGAQRACTRSAGAGTCIGVETCVPAEGWVGCNAKQPLAELCNGDDDDCDGAIDDGAGGGAACANANPIGVCAGTSQCNGKGGLVCVGPLAQVEVCNGKDDDCDGATDELAYDAKLGVYASLQHCGGCQQGCATPNAPKTKAVCVVASGASGKATATCGIACDPGFFDANASAADGCECQAGAVADGPGGGDLDCDGVDGDADSSVFVAKTGDDAWPGTPAKPLRTIAAGIAAAAKAKRPHVLIGGGAYAEAVALQAGVSLWGGYAPGFAVRDPAAWPTSVAAPLGAGTLPGSGDVATVRGQGIVGAPGSSRLDGLTVTGPTATTPGASSYAIHLRDCDAAVALVACRVEGGVAAAGAAGGAGSNGLPGAPGGAGAPGGDIGAAACDGSKLAPGGKGGVRSCEAVAISGGDGGGQVCPDFHEDVAPPQCSVGYSDPKQTATPAAVGKAGKGPAGGGGGLAGADAYTDSWDGKSSKCYDTSRDCGNCTVPLIERDGGSGGAGAHGAPGSGGGAGAGEVVTAGGVRGASGKAGGAGAPGSGGGGGGGGGGVEVVGCKAEIGYSDVGGSGGGGGSGGCGGGGGKAGGGGGAAVGVWIATATATTPTIQGCTFVGGKGGAGGAGGNGGYGGSGAPGGAAGPGQPADPQAECAPEGGEGGDGGNGGSGGGGGGGAGGGVWALAGQGGGNAAIQAFAAGGNTVLTLGVAGAAGPGGAGAPGDGKPGAAGKVAATAGWP